MDKNYNVDVLFVTSYSPDKTQAPGGDTQNTEYTMATGSKASGADTVIRFNMLDKDGASQGDQGTVRYEYVVEILNGGVWVETDDGRAPWTSVITARPVLTASLFPSDSSKNASDIRVTITATNSTFGTVEGTATITAKAS